jgi:hypothetical protein
MDADSYEEHIFSFLIDKYEHPINILEKYKESFPYFVGETLQKSLKIYEEGKNKSRKDIVSILKFHKSVPSYLLKFYERSTIVYPEEAREIKSKSANLQS